MFRLDKSARTPILCYVTDRKSLAAGRGDDQWASMLAHIGSTAAAGVDWIQIREKNLSGRKYSLIVRAAIGQTRGSNDESARAARIIVNDRVDVALAEQAGGVHLGEKSLPVENVCKWLRTNPVRSRAAGFLVGVSCHSLDGAIAVAQKGADYIFFGPVFATPSKAAFGAAQGVERLAQVCGAIQIPVLAIGGVTRENAAACMEAGATGIAAIRLFQDADDLASLICDLRAIAGDR